MRNLTCFAILAVSILCTPASCSGQELLPGTATRAREKKPVDSVALFAYDEFVAGCLVRPARLFDDPYITTLPIGLIVPDPVSLGRLKTMGVEELVVFCGPGVESQETHPAATSIEWAAAARFASDVSLQKVMRQWRESVVPSVAGLDSTATAIALDGHECYRVPSGSFFPPQRTFGTLSFIDGDGQPTKVGVNIGNIYEHRSYVEGGTRAAAVFHLDGIGESDFARDELLLELRTDVFWTLFSHGEFDVAWISVRNPSTELRSEPIGFKVASHVNQRISIPRSLTYLDADGVAREADLMTQFVSNGQLEISIQSSSSGVYMGFAYDDLNVKREEFEFVCVSGRELVVARSLVVLGRMLESKNKPVELGVQLSSSQADVAIHAKVDNAKQREALRQLTSAVLGHAITTQSFETIVDFSASLHIEGEAAVQIEAEFTSAEAAEIAKGRFLEWIKQAETDIKRHIADSIPWVEVGFNMLPIVLDGISLSIVKSGPEAEEERIRELHRLVEQLLTTSQCNLQGRRLMLQLPPVHNYSLLPESAKIGLINLQEDIAKALRARGRYDLFVEHYRYVTEQMPDVPHIWLRCAHEFSFNTSEEFNGFESHYSWVQRGLNVLLDGLERNPDDLRLTWMLAKFIGQKIGQADERHEFRRYFSLDQELRERLGKLIDIERAKSPLFDVDSWLVANLLYEKCAALAANAPRRSFISPVLLATRPPVTQARYASELIEMGRCEQAVPVWETVDRRLRDVGDQVLQLNSEPIRFADLEAELGRVNPNAEEIERLRSARSVIAYDYWLTRASLETTRQLGEARKLAQQAREHQVVNEDERSFELSTLALESLMKLRELHPREFALLAGEFRGIASVYRDCAKKLSKTEPPRFSDVLTLIDKTDPYSPSDFGNWKRFDDGDLEIK